MAWHVDEPSPEDRAGDGRLTFRVVGWLSRSTGVS